MYIIGGRNQKGQALNDIWVFSMEKPHWRQIIPKNDPDAYGEISMEPVGRSGHSASIVKDKMVIFGGLFEITKELNDMHVFDLSTERWVKVYEDEENLSPIRMQSASSRQQTLAKKGALALRQSQDPS